MTNTAAATHPDTFTRRLRRYCDVTADRARRIVRLTATPLTSPVRINPLPAAPATPPPALPETGPLADYTDHTHCGGRFNRINRRTHWVTNPNGTLSVADTRLD